MIPEMSRGSMWSSTRASDSRDDGDVTNVTHEVEIVLGAIVSPTDSSAAAAIGERLHLPRRLVVQLEGEGLTNDTTALVAYRMAIAAVMTGSFSLAQAGRQFVQLGAGGVLIGGAVGWLALRPRR